MLVGAIVFLVIANLATLATFWITRAKRPPGHLEKPSEFLIRELGFNEQQKEQYLKLVKEHQRGSEEILRPGQEIRNRLFTAVERKENTDSLKKLAFQSAFDSKEKLSLLTFEHFQKVRDLCTPKQKEKFDKIIQDVLQMMVVPHPPGPAGQGPPPLPGDKDGDRPPPPQ